MRRDVFKLSRLPAGAKADALAQVSRELYARRQNLAEKLDTALVTGLPVSDEANQILTLIKQNQVVIVAGETGSGKTTQAAENLLQAGLGSSGVIGHTTTPTHRRSHCGNALPKRPVRNLGVRWVTRFVFLTKPETKP